MIGVFAALMIALMAVGFTYAQWSETLLISGTVNTGTVDATLTAPQMAGWGFVFDTEPLGTDYSSIAGSVTGDTLTVTITNAYPGIDYYQMMNLENTGTLPWTATVVYTTIPTGVTVEILHYTNVPTSIVTTVPLLANGVQCDPTEITSGWLHVEVDNSAAQGQTLTFTVTIAVTS